MYNLEPGSTKAQIECWKADMEAEKELTQKSNSIINSVKRLERAGAESSRMTKKLKAACEEVAQMIIDKCPAYIELPRKYKVVKCQYLDAHMNIDSDDGWDWCLKTSNSSGHTLDDRWYVFGVKEIGHTPNPSYEGLTPANRETCLKFSKDIAEGLLDEVAELLEKRAEESRRAIEEDICNSRMAQSLIDVLNKPEVE